MQTSDCEANASLSSMRSRSSTPMPARSSALRVAGIGPMPITAGSTPATAVETTRAIGRSPSSRARSASTTSTADAPSLMPGAVAGRDRAAVALERRPQPREAPRREVSAAGCSSRSTTTGLALAPATSTGTIWSSKRPASIAATRALLALEGEGVLAFAADTPQRSATFSAVSPIEYG